MAQLAPITLVTPGSRGLNKEKEFNLLSPLWATEANNCIIDAGGRLAARKGWADQTATAISGAHSIDVLHEYIQKDGTTLLISAANNKLYKGISDYTVVANDITSTTAPTADNWQFVNFNNKVLGFQRGHTPITWENSGDFTDASYTGTGPDGNCAVAAFGRVWAADADLQTVRYSVLLDETDYSTANGGGTIDMASVWTQGMDEIVAIGAMGANLFVFGKNHIVIWADGTGSEIGINPDNMYVVDTIEGTGCLARDSLVSIGEGDLWFLSRHGVQSLKRVIQDKNNPLAAITKNVKSDLLGRISTELASDANLDAVRAIHSPENGMYLLFLPTNDDIIYIDTKRPFPDEDGDISYAVTEWAMSGTIKCGLVRGNGDLLLGSDGVVGRYENNDDDGTAYIMSFWSAWLDLGPEANNRMKMLKELSSIIQIGGTGSATYRWEFDFSGNSASKTISYTAPTAAEFNIAEWNLDEFSGAQTIQRKTFPGADQGQFLRVGSNISIDGFSFVIQQLQLSSKLGRLAV